MYYVDINSGGTQTKHESKTSPPPRLVATIQGRSIISTTGNPRTWSMIAPGSELIFTLYSPRVA